MSVDLAGLLDDVSAVGNPKLNQIFQKKVYLLA